MAARLLLLSTSKVYGSGYLGYCDTEIHTFLDGIERLLFVPFARPSGMSHDDYTEVARERFAELGIAVTGLHEADDATRAVREAEAVFVGGGNTFVLLNELYATGVLEEIKTLAIDGMPYMGASAGSNVAGLTIGTTNDMPIVYPPSFDALGLLPFNINPHYIDPQAGSTHMGESRETRIREFHFFNTQPVVGIREGAILHLEGDSLRLEGNGGGRLFRPGVDAEELDSGADLGFLLRE
jgi:dipeptidase E